MKKIRLAIKKQQKNNNTLLKNANKLKRTGNVLYKLEQFERIKRKNVK